MYQCCMYLLVNECILPINVYIGEEKVSLRLFEDVFLVGNFSNKISPEVSSALNKCDEMDQVHENWCTAAFPSRLL